jgi:4-azaleucine resistance transporter AzlC
METKIPAVQGSSSKISEFVSGVKDELPILVGTVPFGLIFGALALDSGIRAGTAQAMSVIIFAGSAQFISAQLAGAGAPGLVIVLTAFVVNLRHLLYSASVAPHTRRLHPLWKWSLAYLLTDEAYAVTIVHYDRKGDHEEGHYYFLGAGLALWATWQLSTAAGITLGAVIPSSWSLDFTLALTFIALVTPAIQDRAGVAAALTAGLVAVLAYGLPLKLGLILAAIAGILAGLWIELKT